MADMVKVEEWLGEIPSPQTRKSYRSGIKNFEKWHIKPIETLIAQTDDELGHVINKYYGFVKESHPQNTCRSMVNPVVQYLKYYGKNPKYKKNLAVCPHYWHFNPRNR